MLKFFIDFDGTITKQDVGDALFETFGGEQCKTFVEEYKLENLSAVQCYEKESAACGDVDVQALKDFLDRQEIDDSFSAFVEYCRRQEFEYYIVSDGMDYYIKHILAKNHLSDVPLFANVLNLVPTGNNRSRVRFTPEFPYTDEVCTRCASCKRNHILSLTGEEDIIAYVGEGYSDRCPVRYADIIFAKDDLLKYCRREQIPHIEYFTFSDVIKKVDALITRKRRRTKIQMKKRRLAELARREVFMGG